MNAADDLFSDLAPRRGVHTAPPPSPSAADDLFADLAPPEPKRNAFAYANDFMIDTANAAAGLTKAGIDLVAPGSAPSRAIEGFIESGRNRSPTGRRRSVLGLARSLPVQTANWTRPAST